MLFPEQALLADRRCIRFISIPFVASSIQVRYGYQQAIAGVFLLLAMLTIAFLLLAWKNRRRRRTEHQWLGRLIPTTTPFRGTRRPESGLRSRSCGPT